MEIALDAMTAHAVSDECETFERDLPHAPRVREAHLFDERFLSARETGDSLSAASPGRAPANAFRFEQSNTVATLRQVQRRGAPCDAAADYAHVRDNFTFERRPGRSRVGGC
jgi:hypothetical protein